MDDEEEMLQAMGAGWYTPPPSPAMPPVEAPPFTPMYPDAGTLPSPVWSSVGQAVGWTDPFERGPGAPNIPYTTTVQMARSQLEAMGLPGEMMDLASELKTDTGYYTPGQDFLAGTSFGPGELALPDMPVPAYGEAPPTYRWPGGGSSPTDPTYVAIHEALHAFEMMLTPKERELLMQLMAKFPPPAGIPSRHHPYSGDPRNPVTGLTAYFDYVNAPTFNEPGTRYSPPPAIFQFIRDLMPVMRNRAESLKKKAPNG